MMQTRLYIVALFVACLFGDLATASACRCDYKQRKQLLPKNGQTDVPLQTHILFLAVGPTGMEYQRARIEDYLLFLEPGLKPIPMTGTLIGQLVYFKPKNALTPGSWYRLVFRDVSQKGADGTFAQQLVTRFKTATQPTRLVEPKNKSAIVKIVRQPPREVGPKCERRTELVDFQLSDPGLPANQRQFYYWRLEGQLAGKWQTITAMPATKNLIQTGNAPCQGGPGFSIESVDRIRVSLVRVDERTWIGAPRTTAKLRARDWTAKQYWGSIIVVAVLLLFSIGILLNNWLKGRKERAS